MSKVITCNMCGRRFDIWDIQENFSIHKHLGYGMRFDGDDIELDICCKCMEKLIAGCVVSPVVSISNEPE